MPNRRGVLEDLQLYFGREGLKNGEVHDGMRREEG
jgi:hypothetical protein